MKHIFVINPVAGKKDSTEEIREAVSKRLNADEYVIYVTKKPLDAWRFVHEYAAARPDEPLRFYACGGDGTLNEVVNGAAGFPNAAVGCYPSDRGTISSSTSGRRRIFSISMRSWSVRKSKSTCCGLATGT